MDKYSEGLISISDAVGMFRKPISSNEKPYTRICLENNNRLLDEWEKELLSRIADKEGRVSVGKIWDTIQLMVEGKEIRALAKNFDLLYDSNIEEEVKRIPSQKTLKWIEYLETTSFEELSVLGSYFIYKGWERIMDEIKLYAAFEKLKKIFYDDDVFGWYTRSEENKQLMTTDISAFLEDFGLTSFRWKEISDKVQVLISNRLEPSA